MGNEFAVSVSFTVRAKNREQARNIVRRYLELTNPPTEIGDTFDVSTNTIALGSFTENGED